jgi:hypothetical protein
MDNEEARFILRSFRPDGADVNDPGFTAALKLAVENRELGEWLANERAFDAGFARVLGEVDLPETLRQDILACLAGEHGEFPQPEVPLDAALVAALASVQAPPRLRAAVITAMNRTLAPEPRKISVLRRAAIPLAAAAGIALAFFFTQPGDQAAQVSRMSALPISAVQAGFLSTYESPSFQLDERRDDQQQLIRALKARQLPCPGHLPTGLEGVDGIGCRELIIDGKRGSLVCFDLRGHGVVHMVIFLKRDVSCKLPSRKQPKFSQVKEWATARWSDGDKVFLILSRAEAKTLEELF